MSKSYLNHYNFSRDLAKLSKKYLDIPSLDLRTKGIAKLAVVLHHASQKFMLPSGGVLLEDKDLKTLGSCELRLPYPCIALEFMTDNSLVVTHPESNLVDGLGNSLSIGTKLKMPRIILYVQEQEEAIRIYPYVFLAHDASWEGISQMDIPKVNYRDGTRFRVDYELSPEDRGVTSGLGGYCASRVLAFINALNCRNVKVTKSPKKQGGKVKEALPYDDYYSLTIDVAKRKGESDAEYTIRNRRSPREHLRMGHIRTYPDHTIWINSVVVCAGTKGKITKDYRVVNSDIRMAA